MIRKKLHSSASYYFIVKLGIHTFNHILLSRVLGGNDYQLEDEHTISLNLKMGFVDFVPRTNFAEGQMFLATYAGMSIQKKNLSDTAYVHIISTSSSQQPQIEHLIHANTEARRRRRQHGGSAQRDCGGSLAAAGQRTYVCRLVLGRISK